MCALLRTDILKAKEDQRLYRGLLLDNEMKVILISDPEMDKCAAALEVNVGHMCDPVKIPGLAHFCEHMLFLGTKKYPSENEFAKYLIDHGGLTNAFTTTTSTQYYFEVVPDYLFGALDRFVQLFIAPLFSESSTDREVHAVNSECEMRCFQEISLVNHLRHANKDTQDGEDIRLFTLSDCSKKLGINIRNELIRFYEDWYSANLMTLAVLSRESLDELESIIVPLFQQVVNKKVMPRERLQYHKDLNYSKMKGYIVPSQDLRGMHIAFCLPDFRQYYKSAPCQYMEHLIAHEGQGSLLSALKNKGWCNTLRSDSKYSTEGVLFFNIIVDLTAAGIDHVDDIILVMFQYLQMLRDEGPKQWIFEEYREITSASFRFKDKENAVNYVSEIATNSFIYPLEEVLTGYYDCSDWNPQLITDVLDYLVPDNISILVHGRKFASTCPPVYNRISKLEKISPALIQKWESCGTLEELHLPPPNVFIPSTYDLYPLEENARKHPYIIYDSPFTRVWFKQDDRFFLPKGKMIFNIHSPLAYADPLNCCLSNLFVILLKDSLNECAYDACLAGILWEPDDVNPGFKFTIDGYNDKQSVLLKLIFERIISLVVDDKRFERLKDKFVRDVRNCEREQPFKQAMWHLSILTSEYGWTFDDFKGVENQLTPEAVRNFIPRFFSTCKIEGFIHGNFYREAVLDIAKMPEEIFFQGKFCLLPLLPSELTKHRHIQMSDGCNYVYNQHHESHKSSCCTIYYQCNIENTQTNMELELLDQIIKEPCFDILRTKEQLGYIVKTKIHRSNGVQGLVIRVQSDRHPTYLNQRIEAFLLYIHELLNNMSDEEFERHRQALVALRLEKPKKLADQTDIYWREINTRQYHFDRTNVEVAYLRTISRDAVIAFFNKYLAYNAPHRRKLAVHMISVAKGGAGTYSKPCIEVLSGVLRGLTKPPPYKEPIVIEDITEFKNNQGLYQHPQPYTAINEFIDMRSA